MPRRASSTRPTISACGSPRTCSRLSGRSRLSATTPRTRRRGSPGSQPPVFEDKEATFAELRARDRPTLDYLKTSTPKRSTPARTAKSYSRSARTRLKMRGRELSPAFRAAELLFPSDDRLRHPALRRRRDRQARFPRRRAGVSPHDLHSRNRVHEHHETARRPAHVAGRRPRQTVYLAGQVADQAEGQSVGEQTRKFSRPSTGLLAEAGLRQDEASCPPRSIWPTSGLSPR